MKYDAMPNFSFLGSTTTLIAIAVAALGAPVAVGQTPPPDAKPAPPQAAPQGPLAPLAWLEGCWRGAVNQREYREHWMPLRGNMMIGTSHTVMQDKTQDFEYLRLEVRADGVYYVAVPSGKSETTFKLTETTTPQMADRNDEIFDFTNPTLEFPTKISYRRATEGWLYATVEGKVQGEERKVIYPMRRIDCQTGELLRR